MAMLSEDIRPADVEEVNLNDYGNTDYYITTEDDEIGEGELEVIDSSSEEYRLDFGARSVGVDMGYPYYISKIELHVTDAENSRISKDSIAVYTSMSNRDESYELSNIATYTEELTDGVGTITIELEVPITARYVKVNSLFNTRDVEYVTENDSTLGLDEAIPFTIYRLTGGSRNEFYLYDAKGNRIRKTIMEDSTIATDDYEYYGNSDWLKSDGVYDYTYDNNGNRTSKTIIGLDISDDNYEKWVYTYDLRNRLIQVDKIIKDSLTTTSTYIYDVEGYRIEKETSEGVITNFVFDLSGNMIEEVVEDNSTQYVFMGMTHIAKIVSEGNVVDRYFFGTNHLGSTTLLIDENGEEVYNDETNPFGDQENKEMFYTGKKWDEDAGLYYFNARWYDADTGNFITEDPIKDGLLWYAYCNYNPMKYTDPTGLAGQKKGTTSSGRSEDERQQYIANKHANRGTGTTRNKQNGSITFGSRDTDTLYRQASRAGYDDWRDAIENGIWRDAAGRYVNKATVASWFNEDGSFTDLAPTGGLHRYSLAAKDSDVVYINRGHNASFPAGYDNEIQIIKNVDHFLKLALESEGIFVVYDPQRGYPNDTLTWADKADIYKEGNFAAVINLHANGTDGVWTSDESLSGSLIMFSGHEEGTRSQLLAASVYNSLVSDGFNMLNVKGYNGLISDVQLYGNKAANILGYSVHFGHNAFYGINTTHNATMVLIELGVHHNVNDWNNFNNVLYIWNYSKSVASGVVQYLTGGN